MKRINIPSHSPLANQLGISRAVRIGNFISVSGTASTEPSGKTAHIGDICNQTKCCIETIKESIEKAGGKLSDTVRTRIILTDISNWKKAAEVFGQYFSEIKPTCTIMEINSFPNPEWLVEIEVDCVIQD